MLDAKQIEEWDSPPNLPVLSQLSQGPNWIVGVVYLTDEGQVNALYSIDQFGLLNTIISDVQRLGTVDRIYIRPATAEDLDKLLDGGFTN